MTSGIPFYTADVFTSEMFGGNQLAVFPAAAGLDTRLMQAIAKELNLSETVFVFPPRLHPHQETQDLHSGHRAAVRRSSDLGRGIRAGVDRRSGA